MTIASLAVAAGLDACALTRRGAGAAPNRAPWHRPWRGSVDGVACLHLGEAAAAGRSVLNALLVGQIARGAIFAAHGVKRNERDVPHSAPQAKNRQ